MPGLLRSAVAMVTATVAGWSVSGVKPVVAGSAQTFPPALQPLVHSLRDVGYDVRFAPPPIAGAYGATNARKKIIWVAPISVEMGIARQTLIHEAVHAAQGCPSGRYEKIGWTVTLPRAVDRSIEGILYRKYPHKKFAVEREAFYMQSHPQAFAEISKALKDRCR